MKKLFVLFVIGLFTNGVQPLDVPSLFVGYNFLPGQSPLQTQIQYVPKVSSLNWSQILGQQTTPSATALDERTATTLSLDVRRCMNNCPTTFEYNPVCGTNNITYSNIGKLACAQYCGVDVGLRMRSPCPHSVMAK